MEITFTIGKHASMIQKKSHNYKNVDIKSLYENSLNNNLFNDIYASQGGVSKYLRSQGRKLKLKVSDVNDSAVVRLTLTKKSLFGKKNFEYSDIVWERPNDPKHTFLRDYYKTIEKLVRRLKNDK